jgi:ribosomal 50S subunit-associated protein YjgA (DUF615 family)
MEAVDGVSPEIARIFAAKEQRRQALARLPFPEKVRAVIELQKMAATILRARGKMVRPWDVSAIHSTSLRTGSDEKNPSASRVSATKN